jgi:hypothetical protein
MKNPTGAYYTTKEFAEKYGVSMRMVDYYIKMKELKIDGKFSPYIKEYRWRIPAGTKRVKNPRSPIKGGRPFGSTIENGAKRPERRLKEKKIKINE